MNTYNTPNSIPAILREIQFDIEDEITHQVKTMKFKHTHHSFLRSSQRGIGKSKIALVLEYGQTYFLQGLNYFVLGEKDIPAYMSKDKSHLKNIVVILDGCTNQLITSYKASNPYKQLKNKSKELYKN